MYAEFFGLAEAPFSIAPDPRYLFLSPQHREALAHLLYGTTEGNGFIQLTGEVGTGKTTLVRRLLAELPEGVEIAFIFNPELSRQGLLRAVLGELGIPLPPADADRGVLAERLYRYLIGAHARGRRVVLVIDEAQRLSPEVLEEVRLLTNFETDRRKLLNVILVGQPELRTTLARADLRQLAQRITARYHLGPLGVVETDEYIRHRLRLAGAPGRIFRPQAVRAIARASHGIPRLINLICDRALMAAYARDLREVSAPLVREAVSDLAGVRRRAPRDPRPYYYAAGFVVALVAGAALAWWLSAGPRGSPGPIAAVAAAKDPVQARAMTAVAETVKAAPVATAGNPIMDWAASAKPDVGQATAALLTLWGIPASDAPDPCAAAIAAGLACLDEQGNLNTLRNFNRPTVVTLTLGARSVSAVVQSLDAGKVTLALAPGLARSFSLGDFESLWYGRMWLLWRPPEGANVIQFGMRGPAVSWLRHALGVDAAAGTPFDEALEKAVREFQGKHALVADGIAGPETLIVLNRIHNPESGPRLRG
ncbi:MAG TPA: AAA family ATPase [Gammaproteobacteria bacterium]|nr:AAA family ATPase [Gammaproteobacteria bacterium]